MIKDLWAKIAYFWFISMLVLVGFFSGNLKVNAATQNYSSAYMSAKTCAPNTPSYTCNWYGNWNVNSGYHQPNTTSFQGYLNEWDLHIVGSNSITFVPDKTYSIVMGIGVSSSNVGNGSNQHSLYYYLKQLKKPQFKMVGGPNASESGATTSYIKSFSCTMTENENAINRVYVSCTFVPNSTLKYFRTAIIYGDNTDLYFDQYGFMTIDSFTYSEDSSGAINQQTIIIQNEFNQVNDNINDLNDTITDDSSPDVSGLSDMAGWLPAGPVDSILNLPLTYLNSLITALGGSCSVVQPTLPFINEQIELPCIKSIYNSIGAMNFINWVGLLVSSLILFKYFMNLYKWVDDTLTFRENNYIDNWAGGE